jgi:ATP-binding cassette subfamily B protein
MIGKCGCNKPISSIIVFGIVIAFIIYSFIVQKAQEESNLIANETEDFEKGNVSDFFTNIDSIKYFGKEKLICKKFKDYVLNTEKTSFKFWSYHRWADSGQIFILSVGTLLLLYFPMVKFLSGEITLGTIVFIYTIYGNIIGPMWGFVSGMRGFYRSMADFQDLFEYGKIKKEIKDKPGAEIMQIKRGDIEFKEVDFKYSKKKIFEKFNLKIPSKKKIALVGHSGCGKSTLVNLLYRLYDIDGGAIIIDNKNIRDYKQESLRSEMSIVPQECVLFDDTIWNNIRFSNPRVSREKIWNAIRFAQLDKVINEMPEKEKTIVGERGAKLSGGEKQRVSIARALLADKKILVLDEATSALDSETEFEIQRDLERLMEGRTSIVIAHRLSTIMYADIIVVMKKGQIVEMGNHEDLLKLDGEYKRLWGLQKGGYIK